MPGQTADKQETKSTRTAPQLFTLDIGLPMTICDNLDLLHGPRPLSTSEETVLFNSTGIKTPRARTGFLRLKTANDRVISIQAYYSGLSPDLRLRGSISISALQRVDLFITGTRSSGCIVDKNDEVLFKTTNSKYDTLTLVLKDDDVILPAETSEYFSF